MYLLDARLTLGVNLIKMAATKTFLFQTLALTVGINPACLLAKYLINDWTDFNKTLIK